MRSNWSDAVGNRPDALLLKARTMNAEGSARCGQDPHHTWGVVNNRVECVRCHVDSEDYYASSRR